MKRIKNISILLILVIFCYVIFFSGIKLECIVKSNLGIYCPACGMTRAFIEIMEFNVLNSLSYNVLAIPLFLFIVYSVIALIIDTIKGEDKYIKNILNIFKDYYLIIIVLLIISMLINNIRFN